MLDVYLQVHVRTNPHIIDVSDLPSSMERSEIQKYSFADDDFEVLVLFDLPEPISKEQVCPTWLYQAHTVTAYAFTMLHALGKECCARRLLDLCFQCTFNSGESWLFAMPAAASFWWRMLFCNSAIVRLTCKFARIFDRLPHRFLSCHFLAASSFKTQRATQRNVHDCMASLQAQM